MTIEWVKVSHLKQGDVIVTANEVMEVDCYPVVSSVNLYDYSVINGHEEKHQKKVPSLMGGTRMVDNRVQVIVLDV
jgi:hypothetical protein